MTQTTSLQDQAAQLAELIRPTFARFATEGMTIEDTLRAAVLATKHAEEHAFARRLVDSRIVTALAGTYDEFRSEAE